MGQGRATHGRPYKGLGAHQKAPSRGSWIREGLEKYRTKTEGVPLAISRRFRYNIPMEAPAFTTTPKGK